MGVPVIQVTDLSKRFVIRKEKSLKERLVNHARSNRHKDDFYALRDVSMTIDSGSTVGLVGPNGSGKSTLLKMMGGILQPSSGTVDVRGRIAALLELGAGFHPDLTGRENVYLNASLLGLSRQQTEKYFDAIVDFSGIEKFIDTQVKFYSSGMYVRLGFAVAVHVDPDILLVDEVLAVGDEPFQRKCMDHIKQFQADGRTIIYVSHSLGQVADLCDRAVVLESGRVIADGEPRESLRVLRGEFDQIRADDLDKSSDAAAREDGSVAVSQRARITGISLVGDDGAALRSLPSGSDANVVISVDAPVALDGAVVSVAVSTALGVNVFWTSTGRLGFDTGTITGKSEIRFPLSGIALGEGAYSFEAAIRTAEGVEVARLRDAAPFGVTHDRRSSGIVRFEVGEPSVAPKP